MEATWMHHGGSMEATSRQHGGSVGREATWVRATRSEATQRRFMEATWVGGTMPATCSSVSDAILIEIRQSTTSVPPSTLVPLTCRPISGGSSVSFSCGYCDSQLFRGAVKVSAEVDGGLGRGGADALGANGREHWREGGARRSYSREWLSNAEGAEAEYGQADAARLMSAPRSTIPICSSSSVDALPCA